MDPYSIQPSTSGTSASNDSDAADEVKSEERRHERMVAFRQAIERLSPNRYHRRAPLAALSSGLPLPPHGKAGPSKPLASQSEIPAEVELPADQSLSEQSTDLPGQVAARQSTPTQAQLDPALRQSLLRMQSEGVQLPPSLLELLEQSDEPAKTGVPSAKGKAATPAGESAEQIESSEKSAESVDASAAERRLAANASHGGNAARSDSGSLGGHKNDSTDSADAPTDAPAQLAMPIAMQPPPMPAPGQMQHVPPPPPLVQELVEFATFGRNNDGNLEFRLGLVDSALGGLRIQLASYGNRRVGLKIKGSGGKSASIGDAEIGGLIDALKAKDVEVIDVVRE